MFPLLNDYTSSGVGTWGSFVDHDLNFGRQMMETNVFGAMNTVQAFFPLLRTSDDAVIINIGSSANHITWAWGSVYKATKAALEAWSDELRNELAPFK